MLISPHCQDAPVNRIYKWLLGSPVSRTAARKPQRSVLGVHQMEDRVVPAAVPMTGPNGLPLELVDTLAVQYDTHVIDGDPGQYPTTSVPLADDVQYVVVARNGVGAEQPRIANGTTGVADAEYIRYNQAGGPYDETTVSPFKDVGTRLTGVDEANTTSFWGAYESDHQYVQTVTGQGAVLSAYFNGLMNSAWDNSGIVYVDVYREQLPAVSVSTTTPTVLETEVSPGVSRKAQFTISLNIPATYIIEVPYGTSSDAYRLGEATAGVDYEAVGGVATFAVGQTTYLVEVPITDDANWFEDDEELFNFVIDVPPGTPVGATSVEVKIIDDDTPPGPVAVADDAKVQAGQPFSVPVLSNDIDNYGDGLTIVSVGSASYGTVAIVDGMIVYMSTTGYSGSDTFGYTIEDASGLQSTATVTIDVASDGFIGSMVWNDIDGDGLRSPEEHGVADVLVELYTEFGAVAVVSALTDEYGVYSISTVALSSGTYKLKFTTPYGQDFAPQQLGDPVNGSKPDVQGWTNPFVVTGPNEFFVNQNAGVKALSHNLSLAPLEGKLMLRGNGGLRIPANVIKTNAQGEYYIPVLDPDVANPRIVKYRTAAGVIQSFDLLTVGPAYQWGQSAVGNIYESGKPELNPADSNKYYWAQYVKTSEYESVAGAYGAMVPEGDDEPGKWYVDAPKQWREGFPDSYSRQIMDTNHPMDDSPSFVYGIGDVGYAAGASPNYRVNAAGDGVELWWKVDKTAQQILNDKFAAAVAAVGGSDFIVHHAVAFQTYIVPQGKTEPIGYYSWGYRLEFNSATKTAVIVESDKTWTAGKDNAVFLNSPLSP